MHHLTSFIFTPFAINKFSKSPWLPKITPHYSSRRNQSPRASLRPYTTVLVIPTGIGATIGGYAGDALPIVRLVSTTVDIVITHPNALNGALMYWPIPNALYVEGFALDQFAAGRLALQPTSVKSNRIGLVFDCAMENKAILRHKQAAEAARATLGLQVTDFAITTNTLNVDLATSTSGASWGRISHPASLLDASEKLLAKGCEAIAVVAKFPEDEDEQQLAQYRAGNAVDAIAGAEAVISHLVTREFYVPCAHAPSLPPLEADDSVSPKAAAEELGYTFLSCVLVGLSKAPRLLPINSYQNVGTVITADHVDSVIVPADSFGGGAIMSLAANRNMLVVAVLDNPTALDVDPGSVGIDPNRVLFAKSYAEAVGFIAAHKAGLDIPALGKGVPRLSHTG